MHPPRHALGALLLDQADADERHVDEAEAVYRADLGLDASLPRPSWHPNNVWSLHGLVECYERRGDTRADEFRQQLARALEHTDFDLQSSCACRVSCCDD